jgi:hypothetical protein
MPRPERGATPGGFRRQLLARLQNHARDERVSAQWLQQVVAFEQFLARLPDSGEWILKGGFALEMRYGWRFRQTRDIDLSTQLEPDEALARLRLALSESGIRDNFSFELGSAAEEMRGAPGGGLRVRVVARVAGDVFATFHVDLASNDAILGVPDRFEGSSLLSFANIETIRFPVYPVPEQLAEKFHAYTLPRNDENTPVKDLVDIIMLTTIEIVHAQALMSSVRATFGRRATHTVPPALPLPPQSWTSTFARLASSSPAMPTLDLIEGHDLAAQFWNPIISGGITSGIWFPVPRSWRAADNM